MATINQRNPGTMHREERLDEVATILASGLLRLGDTPQRESEFGLGFSGDQSVHTDPSNPVAESA